jgi:hypothetical protein
VVVEVALAHTARAENVVERGGVVALEVDQAGGSVENLVPRRGSLCMPVEPLYERLYRVVGIIVNRI